MKCILCKSPAMLGLIYCAPHYEHASRLTLAEKLAEQRAAGWIADIPLPGFENAEGERAEVMAVEQAEELSATLASPKASIEAKAGAIEQHSPLFRGHGPQGELFDDANRFGGGISAFAHSEHVHGSGNANG